MSTDPFMATDPLFILFIPFLQEKKQRLQCDSRAAKKMAALIVGILSILQKVFCGGGGNVDGKPNQQGNNDYYNNQQQQVNQGFPPLQQNNYPPQQGIGRPPQNAWNGQHGNGQHNNGYQNQQYNNNHNGPYQASNQANLQRPNYQGPGGLVGGAIVGPNHKQVRNSAPGLTTHSTDPAISRMQT
jgi:hypothetical protein